uniref:Uncharacterized protein n=2 Tax=Pseudictyota dubia TaxID=2749911 RepID=A0A7R9W4R8_9STRA
MDEICHSTYHGEEAVLYGDGTSRISSSENGQECRMIVERKRSILALFTSALPMTVVSILLWAKRNVSTMGLTTYIGISAVAISIYISVDPLGDRFQDFLEWWFSISGALWLAILTDIFFSNRPSVDLAPLVWGLNLGALAFMTGMIALTGVLQEDTLWRWLLLNVLSFAPLGVLGTATNQIFLLLLCALGFLADSFRLASWFVEGASPNVEVPIYFLVLAFAGLSISGFGWFLNRRQAMIHASLSRWFEQHSLSRVRRVDPEYDPLQADASSSRSSHPSSQGEGSFDDVGA